MSVLICGMEMPTSCVDCRFHKRIHCTLTDICTNTAQGCPLVPVPPHGRLIDADALEPDTDWLYGDDGFTAFSKLAIECAPTIIEGDKE